MRSGPRDGSGTKNKRKKRPGFSHRHDEHELALQLFLVWYFLMGFLLGNGVPHFAFGSAGKAFRSPFGQRSSARTNVLWGLSNFVAATIIAAGLITLNLYSSYALVALFIGFWLVMLMFGTGIKRFLNE
jgi:hypothetical protein